MSDLLSIGLSGIRANTAALRVVGENIANADDPAYVRRRLNMAEVPMPVRGSPLYRTQNVASGVEITGTARSADPLIDAALRRAEGARAESNARADWLGRLEIALGDGEFSVGRRMTAFFSAGTQLTANPDDPARRMAMIDALDRVTAGFADSASRIDAVDADLTATMDAKVGTLNTRLTDLAAINRDLRAARPGSAAQAQLFDRRDAALRDIAGTLRVDIAFDAHGGAILTAGGATLVDATTVNAVSASRAPGGGISLAAGPTPIMATGGELGGLDRAGISIHAARTALDMQAVDFASAINSWNASGITSGGAPGGALLSGSSADNLALATSNPAAIAAGTISGGPNGNVLALDALRGSTGGEAVWNGFVGSHASALNHARADADAAALMADHAAAQRDQLSGVDLDREAAEMLRLEQAYGAAARVLQVARDTVQTILDIV